MHWKFQLKQNSGYLLHEGRRLRPRNWCSSLPKAMERVAWWQVSQLKCALAGTAPNGMGGGCWSISPEIFRESGGKRKTHGIAAW